MSDSHECPRRNGSHERSSPKTCVWSEITGGLANQMFQYAAGLAAARTHATSLVVDARRECGIGGQGFRLPDLGLGDASVLVTTPPWLDVAASRIPGIPRKWAARRNGRAALEPPQEGREWRARGFNYDESFQDQGAGTWFRGHFQSERYFACVREEVRATFLAGRKRLASALPKSAHPRVAIHVRRGDYLHPRLKDLHPVMDISYYEGAIDLARERLGKFSLYVFSDTPQWTAPRFSRFSAIILPPSRSPAGDLLAMTLADAHIIANSSYSWWGAWLADSQLTVAPTTWFGDASIDTSDLIPNSWITI